MGFWGKLFGTDEAIKSGCKIAEEATGGIINGIDKIFYTNEEKAENAAQIVSMAMKHAEALQDQSLPRSISRRIIAFAVVGNYLIAFNLCLVLACFKQLDTIKTIVEIMGVFEVSWITLAIVFFYFGGEAIKRIKQGG